MSAVISQLESNLTDNILPYWMDRMVDDVNGGFYGRRDGFDRLWPDAEKGAIMNARILWSFAAAYAATGRAEYLAMAVRARDYILRYFVDHEFGGVYWSVNADGTPSDTKKQFYAIAFTIYGLAEYSMAVGGDAVSLDAAMKLYHDIERHSRDREMGGYFEATTREWMPIADMRLSDKDANSSKTMNTHLHILEAYSALLRATGDPDVRESTMSLLRVFLDHIIDKNTRHMGLFFNDAWERQDGIISYGHDIEASWLLLEAARSVGDNEMEAEVMHATKHLAMAALQGLCVDGSMVYERHADGRYDNEKHWWVQAEALVGQLYLYRYHGMAQYLTSALKTWSYIKGALVDAECGEWYWSRLPDGSINRNEDKAGFWKCPYHNSRACLEAISLLK
ncbi:MAG: AGE family epimerase/isomerase [Muribaculaceae bacterium]|nr:AGE family epimerase/isomerase [Muribaculaceae bacterium]